ncbi:MAG: FAD-binding oxidoreductase [Thermodesulfobacteriota bacterium]
MLTTDQRISKLREVAGKASFIRDRAKLEAYALDGKRPKVIVSPRTVEEVSQIVAYANRERLALVPMGNRTKMGMGGIPKKIDVVLQTTRLNHITDCDIDNLTLTAEAGITLNQVQRRLAKEGKGYFLPLDPPFTDKATLGGILATNSSGPKRLLYGTARDLVIGTKVVLPSGDIVVSGGKTVKNVSGYDLSKLLIGSFGTLGVICEITFKLLPLPEREASLLVPFKSLEDADAFVQEITHSQLLPASVETLNALAVSRMKYRVSLPAEGSYLAAIGLEGVAESTERQISEMGNIGKRHGALESMVLDSERHHAFWKALRDFSKGLAKRYPDHVALKSNFLISKFGQMMGSYEKVARGLGMECAFVGHSGSGILYTYVLGHSEGRLKIESLIQLIKKLTAEAAKNEGNLVIESSPSSLKKKVNVWGKSRDDALVMRRIKKQIDPKGILNPARFVAGI